MGSGAREHVLSEAYENSPEVGTIIISPGNDYIGFKRNKTIIIEKNSNLKQPESILKIAEKYKPDLVDVAQDDALAHGTVDLLQTYGYKVFGPRRNSARIEWDKAWSRRFMKTHNIPHPNFEVFTSEKDALQYISEAYGNQKDKILFVKASGLAAGKGALKSTNFKEAEQNIRKMKNFGDSGKTFLIEEGLIGEEFSVYALSDGENFIVFPPAQDFKLADDFDTGEQTGGMGSISHPYIVKNRIDEIVKVFVQPVIKGLKDEGEPFVGILYFSGIVLPSGEIKAIEYNARWGDPESQVVIPGILGSYYEMIERCIKGNLTQSQKFHDEIKRLCVVGASKGYPGDYRNVKGKQIYGLEKVANNVSLYSGGIALDPLPTVNGGRLFSLVAQGEDIIDLRSKIYREISKIFIEGNNLHYRKDIGWQEAQHFWHKFNDK